MKKIFLSSVALLAFSLSIILFQMSCKKEAKADTSTAPVLQQNKILYIDYGTGAGNGTVWTANYDGTNAQKINIVLPSGLAIGDHVKISPDRKTLFVDAYTLTGTLTSSIYSCNIDGSNLHLVVSGNLDIDEAY